SLSAALPGSGPYQAGTLGICSTSSPAGPRDPCPAFPDYRSTLNSGQKVQAERGPTARKGSRGKPLMEYHDKVLKCSECGAEFAFTAGEQMFFADKGFKNEPKRCKACKAKRAEGGGGGGGGAGATQMRAETKTTCSQCGKETTVPFRPTQ